MALQERGERRQNGDTYENNVTKKMRHSRSQKLTPTQHQYVIRYMARHKQFARDSYDDFNKNSKDKMWTALTKRLNMLGPYKDIKQWKMAWRDMKHRVRKYVKEHDKDPINTSAAPKYVREMLEILDAEIAEYKAEKIEEDDNNILDEDDNILDEEMTAEEIIDDESLPTISWEEPAEKIETLDSPTDDFCDENEDLQQEPFEENVTPVSPQMTQFQNTILEMSRKQTEMLEKFMEQYKRDEEKRTALEERTVRLHERVVALEEKLLKIIESEQRSAL